MAGRLFAAAGLLLVTVPAAWAQAPDAFIESGIAAYDRLDFDAATGLLRRGLAIESLRDPEVRARGLSYLGATEIYRGNLDSARAAFGRLVRANPRYRIDRLIFPPEVTGVFDAARRAIRAVAVQVADSVAFPAGEPGFAPWLYASSFHEIEVAIQRADGTTVRRLYRGPVGDSLEVEWDGRSGNDELPVSGRYVLNVTSLTETGDIARLVRVPLRVIVVGRDTLPHPPAPSGLLAERLEARPGIEALGGIALGVGLVALSSAIAREGELSATRFVVGGVVSLAGVIGFVRNRPGRPIPENIADNARRLATWRADVAEVAETNITIRTNRQVAVRADAPQVIEPES